MSHEERSSLLDEIENIRTMIEKLEPEIHRQKKPSWYEFENSRARLVALRKQLARDMEQLHES